MYRCLKSCGAALRVLAVLALAVVWAGPTAAESRLGIDDVKIDVNRLPNSWIMERAIELSAADVGRFEKRFAASIDAILNQHFTVGNAENVQVNYVACSSEQNAGSVYSGLIGLVGTDNAIVRNQNVVVEIISDSNKLMREARSLLNLSPLQGRKLTVADVPAPWRLVKEFFLTEEGIAAFEERFGSDIDEIVNQFFLVDEMQVRINYVSCPTGAAAQQTYAAIERLVGEKNRVFRLDAIVCEIIAGDAGIKNEAERLLKAGR